ncbi:hypothetical protein [Sinorhizobium meliloti]|uniref:hypothetical protein n=1 Tax=Rhizobium meliloti TaxID=382 RepID=UPI000FD9F474|nr:hypothetical protein [Sinorhizobium meliloti]RVQ10031.1 hypothetical protein CN067_34020 [Sinorhizobium meliloti]RVQ55747.1 hypothetical protein CN060_21100 [Sinorhizobium meliloti]
MNAFNLRKNEGIAMGWNFDISAAPRGRTITVTETDKDGKLRERQEFRHDHVILASKCGKVSRSYWIPDEQRWCMFSKNEEPKAWQHWPEWPEDAIATLHAESSEFERLCGEKSHG